MRFSQVPSGIAMLYPVFPVAIFPLFLHVCPRLYSSKYDSFRSELLFVLCSCSIHPIWRDHQEFKGLFQYSSREVL